MLDLTIDVILTREPGSCFFRLAVGGYGVESRAYILFAFLIFFFLSLHTVIRPHGHSRQVGAASVSTRQ